jgi:hypothetical protein
MDLSEEAALPAPGGPLPNADTVPLPLVADGAQEEQEAHVLRSAVLARPAPLVGLPWGARTPSLFGADASLPVHDPARMQARSRAHLHHYCVLQDDCTFIGCGRDQNRHLMAHYNLAKKVRCLPVLRLLPALCGCC